MTALVLDTESTGLDPSCDEVLEIAIVDLDGQVLLESLVQPVHTESWPAAEAIHGITPRMVATAPRLIDLRPRIEALVKGKDVIIYNVGFDVGLLGSALSSARSLQCCMQAWSEHMGEWSDYHGNYRWFTLADAANAIDYDWPSQAHRALADALACRAIWCYLKEPNERARVETIRQEAFTAREAERALLQMEQDEHARKSRKERFMNSFICHWWLRQYGAGEHWSRHYTPADAVEEFSKVFFGKSLQALKLEERFEVVYYQRKAIPDHLKPANYFRKDNWYQAELIPCAAYIGKKRAWPLYDRAEEERLTRLYPLRLAVPVVATTETLVTRTDLRKSGYTDQHIAAMEPVAERQNRNSFEWYYLYKVNK